MERLTLPKSPERLAFIHYLRTGEILPVHLFAPTPELETKFNPYHDPQNGQFTFAPGGGALASSVSDGVYRPGENAAPLLHQIQRFRPPSRGIGGNIGNFYDPMTLEQAFPGLRTMPAGSVVNLAVGLAGPTGPANEMLTSIASDTRSVLLGEIQKYDPTYRHDSFGFPDTTEGQRREVRELRWDRATAILRATGNDEPLKMEAMRFLQERVDAEYDVALRLAKTGALPKAPTEPLAIGNYIDRAVKRDFRDALKARSLYAQTETVIRVSGREYDSSGSDLTYRVPDARIGRTAFDITLSRKQGSAPQILGFFKADFRPTDVVIVRPSQLGPGSTYLIKSPGR